MLLQQVIIFLCLCVYIGAPPLPDHEFNFKRIETGKKKTKIEGKVVIETVPKIHVTLQLEGYYYRRKGFSCNGKRYVLKTLSIILFVYKS
jgi:hypothetical protein